MSYQAKRELLLQTAPRYGAADAALKSRILDEFVYATGFHRKYAIGLLNQPPEPAGKLSRPRARHYSEAAQEALKIAWAACNFICAKRFTPYLSELVPILERHGHLVITDEVRAELNTVSAATVDRILAPARKSPQALSMTKAGAVLKRQIPIRTFTDWEDTKPGFFEADLVCHCGQSTHGAFVCTLTLTDVASGWTEPVALLRRSSRDVLEGVERARELLPFPLLGLDADNGSEFINDDLTKYCEQNGITFTRGRTARKNDQCFVEQKNGAVVRRVVGHDRYEGSRAQQQLSELYSVLRLHVNLFQPSMKLATKSRIGAKSTRTYAVAKTPLQRLVAANCLPPELQDHWLGMTRTLDPVRLLSEMHGLQASLSTHARNGLTVGTAATFLPAKLNLLPLKTHLAKPVERPKVTTETRLYARLRAVQDQLYAWFQENPASTAPAMLRRLQEAYPNQYPDADWRNVKSLLTRWRKLPPGTTYPPKPARRKGRKGTFVAVEHQLRQWFDEDREQSSHCLLHRLQKAYPGQYPNRVVRSLQRLLASWRA